MRLSATLGALALALVPTASADCPHEGDAEWITVNDASLLYHNEPAAILRGDGDLFVTPFKPAKYRLHTSWRVLNQKWLILETQLIASESGGDHTILATPRRWTVLYTAPQGRAIADVILKLPTNVYWTSNDTMEYKGQEQMSDIIDMDANVWVAVFGDYYYGPDVNRLGYTIHLNYKVKLVDWSPTPLDRRVETTPRRPRPPRRLNRPRW